MGIDEPCIELEGIKVKPATNLETDGYSDEDDLYIEMLRHADEVEKMMSNIGAYMEEIGEWHDWTKFKYFDEFKNDCLERLSTPEFKKREWYNIHTIKERHHVNANCPADVNLFDILEMIVDCGVAGKSRSGEVNFKFLELNEGILENAYWNTVQLICDKIVIDDE